MENIRSSYRVFALLFALLWLIACEPPDEATASVNPLFAVNLVDNSDCTIQVTIQQPGVNEAVQVRLINEPGIDILGEREKSVDMFANDTRYPLFQCQLSPDALIFPGEYILWATSNTAGGNSLQSSHTLLNIGKDGNRFTLNSTSEPGKPINLPFEQGDFNFAYLFVVDRDRPQQGVYYIKAISNENGFSPKVNFSTQQGLIFGDPANAAITRQSDTEIEIQFPEMNDGSSRIASIPVRVADDATEGTYGFEATVFNNGDGKTEMAPSAVKVSAENNNRRLQQTSYIVSSSSIEVAPAPTEIPPLPQQRAAKLLPRTSHIPSVTWNAQLTNFDGPLDELFALLIREHGFSSDEWSWFEQNIGAHNPDFVMDNRQFFSHKAYVLPTKVRNTP